MNNVRKLIENINCGTRFIEGEPLKDHTTFKIGGRADYFAAPSTAEGLSSITAALAKAGVPFFVLGGGSNVVFSDEGFEGVVLCTQNLKRIELAEKPQGGLLLKCGCGALMDDAAAFCAENALSGFEAFAGLPGTVGGACYMNARCYGKEVSDALYSAKCFFPHEKAVRDYFPQKGEWAYKKSPFQQNRALVLEAAFEVARGEKSEIGRECARNIEDRRVKGHFSHPSAGSVFKNNREFGAPSGKIIDEAGLRGKRVGGAQIAPWHGNFIVNTGGATAADVRSLVDFIIGEVKAQRGFALEPEILFVGRGFGG